MSLTIDELWVHKFHNNLMLVTQQEASKLEGLIDPGMRHYNIAAAIDYHERLGNVVARDAVVPFAEVVPLNPEHSRRAVTLISSEAPVWVSDEHTMRSMIDPTNGYTRTMVAAINRRKDKHIIDALTGSATTAAVTASSGAITYSTATLPSAHTIGGATAVDLTRIINVGEVLSKAGMPNGAGERVFLYAPGQLRNLMSITQASSSDYTKNMIHDKGTVDGIQWEGFTWLEIADVVDPSLTVLARMLGLTSTTRDCVAFHRSALGISVGRDVKTKIDELPHRGDTIQVRSTISMGAVRVWEGAVVKVQCLEN